MEQLGIQTQAIVMQMINFVILFAVLAKFLYKPILKMLENRKLEIAKGVELTEKMKVEEEKLAQKRNKLMDEGRAEAHQLLTEAKAQSKEEEKSIVAAAHNEAQDIIQKAKEEADRIHASLTPTIQKEASLLAGDMVRRMLSGSLSLEQQHKIISKSIKDIAISKGV